MKSIIIIPARMTSIRLPNKPLADICGLPMIIQVMKRAEESGMGKVYIACAEQEIADAVKQAGGNYMMTDPNHNSGTDRIYEALEKIDPENRYDIIINVQGDLPTINPNIIKNCLKPFENPKVDMTTLVAEITDDSERNNPNVVKAIIAWDKTEKSGKALYFTRATAPANKGSLYHHIGLYAYRRAALKKFTSLEPSTLEKRERLEQLRALENDMRINVVLVDTVPFGVDTQEDLEKARQLLRE